MGFKWLIIPLASLWNWALTFVYYFLCRGENGELRLGIRRTIRPKNWLPDSVTGNQMSYHTVLTSVANAISTNSPFHVFYNPRYYIFPFLLSRKIPADGFLCQATISLFQALHQWVEPSQTAIVYKMHINLLWFSKYCFSSCQRLLQFILLSKIYHTTSFELTLFFPENLKSSDRFKKLLSTRSYHPTHPSGEVF